MTTLDHRVFDSFDALADVRAAWNDLAERTGDLFASADWCATWWRYYGSGRRLEIHTFCDGPRLVGVLPLFHERVWLGGLGLRVVRLLACDHTVDAAGLAVEPEHAGPALRLVLDRLGSRGGWDLLQLGPLRHYVDALETMADDGSEHHQVQAAILGRQDNWLTHFDLPDTYAQYLKSLQGVDRSNLLRRERKLHALGPVEVAAADTPEQIDRAMDALIDLHQHLWAGKGQRGQFLDWPRYGEFHRETAHRLAARGRLALLSLTVAGQVVGVTYGYYCAGRLHSLIRGYRDDEAWRIYGLGRLLHCYAVRHAIEAGARSVDDGRGIFEYKLRFGGQLRGERSLALVRRGWGPRLRVWVALRVAYFVHVLYNRLWFDRLAPRLGWRRPLQAFYIRSSFLAQLFRRARFGLFDRPGRQEALGLEPPPSPASGSQAPATT